MTSPRLEIDEKSPGKICRGPPQQVRAPFLCVLPYHAGLRAARLTIMHQETSARALHQGHSPAAWAAYQGKR